MRALLFGVEFTMFRVRTVYPEHLDKYKTGVLGQRCTFFPLEAVAIAVFWFGALLFGGFFFSLG